MSDTRINNPKDELDKISEIFKAGDFIEGVKALDDFMRNNDNLKYVKKSSKAQKLIQAINHHIILSFAETLSEMAYETCNTVNTKLEENEKLKEAIEEAEQNLQEKKEAEAKAIKDETDVSNLQKKKAEVEEAEAKYKAATKTKKNADAEAMQEGADVATSLTNYIIADIMLSNRNDNSRDFAIERWAAIAQYLQDQGDYFSANAIAGVFSTSAISRIYEDIKETSQYWVGLPKVVRETISELESSHNKIGELVQKALAAKNEIIDSALRVIAIRDRFEAQIGQLEAMDEAEHEEGDEEIIKGLRDKLDEQKLTVTYEPPKNVSSDIKESIKQSIEHTNNDKTKIRDEAANFDPALTSSKKN